MARSHRLLNLQSHQSFLCIHARRRERRTVSTAQAPRPFPNHRETLGGQQKHDSLGGLLLQPRKMQAVGGLRNLQLTYGRHCSNGTTHKKRITHERNEIAYSTRSKERIFNFNDVRKPHTGCQRPTNSTKTNCAICSLRSYGVTGYRLQLPGTTYQAPFCPPTLINRNAADYESPGQLCRPYKTKADT